MISASECLGQYMLFVSRVIIERLADYTYSGVRVLNMIVLLRLRHHECHLYNLVLVKNSILKAIVNGSNSLSTNSTDSNKSRYVPSPIRK